MIALAQRDRGEHELGWIGEAVGRVRDDRIDMIKRLPRKYKYPPDGQEDAVALVIRQAEVLASEFSGN